jgi:hypothetical protein
LRFLVLLTQPRRKKRLNVGIRPTTPAMPPPMSIQPAFHFGTGFDFRSSDPLGIHKQQHDPADERKRSDDRGNEVAVSGLNVHSEEFDRLSRGREGDARVSEHHEAQNDQEDCNNGFCVHIESSV